VSKAAQEATLLVKSLGPAEGVCYETRKPAWDGCMKAALGGGRAPPAGGVCV